jgi:hypothetical protein
VGLKPDWLTDVFLSLEALEIRLYQKFDERLNLLELDGGRLILNLIPIVNDYSPELLLAAQSSYKEQGILLVQLWEDIWVNKKAQVLSRISAILGRNVKIFARKTTIHQLDQDQADEFLINNHLQGSTKARYKFGLRYEGEVVAVATFSATRLMKFKDPVYRSAELIRFASKSGITVTGGMTKLMKHYITLIKPNDLMSYADRDWSLGNGYLVAGFSLDEVREPADLWLDTQSGKRYFSHRKPQEEPGSLYVKIFNTGNLKYILYQ